MEPIRAFIAIELPSQIKAALAQLQDNLRTSKNASVKWVEPQSIHLTLKFLGNVDEAEIPAVTKALSEAVKGVAPFSLQLGDPGAFPDTHAPRVVWVGVGGEIEPLSTLHNNIDRVLAPLGFPPEKRAFSPHLTLGRVRDEALPGEKRRLGENVTSLRTGEKLSFKTESLSLMRSKLSRAGAVYSRLASLALCGDLS
jgi:RNA 2',3'-cyclic 3'-phosphodiesterase